MKPRRIQRKRTKGWKMPQNTVYVGRGSKWGNPFTVIEWGRAMVLQMYERQLRKEISQSPQLLNELRGKNLACWCKPDQPCHADVLLRLANKKGEK